jgi:hypothetical protein
MKYLRFLPLFIFAAAVLSSPVAAQETQIQVVDEVVAQVNEGVITLSRIKREIKAIVDQDVAAGKNREDTERLVNEKKGELIANMINEELLLQRGKELKIDADVEASINQRSLAIMKEYDLKTTEALFELMKKQGVDPQEIREMWRRQATRDMVIQQEVQRALYWGATAAEVKAYYDANKAKFTKPETVSVSEIFLGFAGRDENSVREKAKQLLKELRAGGDFTKIAAENSDPGQMTRGQGKAEKVLVADLVPVIADPLKPVKVGGYTEPIEVDKLGVIILRVDAREQASSESEFNESAVRTAIMQPKMPEAQKKFMAKLRQDAYIKINDEYRPLVAPILFAEERSEKVGKN